jgi:large subunit ribosomal protein L29
MKLTEMRELQVEELEKKVAENRQALFQARMQHAARQLENPSSIRKIKHQTAQLMTLIQEKKQSAACN